MRHTCERDTTHLSAHRCKRVTLPTHDKPVEAVVVEVLLVLAVVRSNGGSMCLTNVCIEAQLFLRKFVVSQAERERDREREVGGVHYLEAYITSTTEDYRRQDCRTLSTAGRH